MEEPKNVAMITKTSPARFAGKDYFVDNRSDTLNNVNRGCVYRRWSIIM